ncbi:MAG: PDR/VanB family oxidoreductase [Pseudomonadota bacterium]
MNAAAKSEAELQPANVTSAKELRLRVRSVTKYGEDIKAFEVFDPTGNDLPQFEAGSHIDLHVPGGSLGVRQYSLCGDPADRGRYTFAVQREPNGRGGSKAIHETLQANSEVAISGPRNHFALRPNAKRHLLLAGGIGITPMMSMICELERNRSEYQLHYCTRSKERTAFLDRLRPLINSGRVVVHWDGGDSSKGLDINGALKNFEDGTHLYYCGPPGFMTVVASASSHWPSGNTHREFFTPSANDPALVASGDKTAEHHEGGLGPAFKLELAKSGMTLDIPSDQTILQVLREHDIQVEAACELGVCGTCRTRVLSGEPDHRDYVLEPQEHETEMTVCCSRSKSPLLVLDL